MKKIIILFMMLNLSIFAEWNIKKSQTNDNMKSVLIEEKEKQSTGLIIVSTNFDGNLSLVYVANLALEKLENSKVFADFNYGYSKESDKYVAIKTIPNGIVTLENSSEEELIKSIESFNKSEFNLE